MRWITSGGSLPVTVTAPCRMLGARTVLGLAVLEESGSPACAFVADGGGATDVGGGAGSAEADGEGGGSAGAGAGAGATGGGTITGGGGGSELHATTIPSPTPASRFMRGSVQ
jgi:hypothetical protein